MSYPFADFLYYFPPVELPVNLTSEYTSVFGQINMPVPEALISDFILDHAIEPNDEDGIENEYIPCFQLPDTKEFKAIVYIKISLLSYEYFLHTFDNAGRTIACKVISAMSSDGKQIKERTAMIDDKYQIWTLEGVSDLDHEFNPSDSLFVRLFINETGEILVK